MESFARKNLRQSGGRPHPCSVRHSGPSSLLRPNRRRASFIFENLRLFVVKFVCILAISSLLAAAQSPAAKQSAQASKSAANSESNNPSSSLAIPADPPALLYQGVPAEIPQDQGMAGLRLEPVGLGAAATLMEIAAPIRCEGGLVVTLVLRTRSASNRL